jgi:hypothetical protein
MAENINFVQSGKTGGEITLTLSEFKQGFANSSQTVKNHSATGTVTAKY